MDLVMTGQAGHTINEHVGNGLGRIDNAWDVPSFSRTKLDRSYTFPKTDNQISSAQLCNATSFGVYIRLFTPRISRITFDMVATSADGHWSFVHTE